MLTVASGSETAGTLEKVVLNAFNAGPAVFTKALFLVALKSLSCFLKTS